MKYKLIYSERSIKQLKKMDKSVIKLITSYMRTIESLDEPRYRGKALSANLKGFWRYRISDYRVICEIIDDKLILVVVEIAHRKNAYKNK